MRRPLVAGLWAWHGVRVSQSTWPTLVRGGQASQQGFDLLSAVSIQKIVFGRSAWPQSSTISIALKVIDSHAA